MSRASLGLTPDRAKKDIPMQSLGQGKYQRIQEAIDEENDNFIDSQMNRQQQIMRQQDLALDELGRVVGRISDMSLAINKELKDQNELIDQVEQGVDHTEGNLAAGLERVNKFLKESDKGSLWIICVLFVILVILIVLVLL